MPENGSRVAMLKAGDAQVIYPVPAQNIDELSNSKDVEVNKVPSTIAHYVSLNTYKNLWMILKFDKPLTMRWTRMLI